MCQSLCEILWQLLERRVDSPVEDEDRDQCLDKLRFPLGHMKVLYPHLKSSRTSSSHFEMPHQITGHVVSIDLDVKRNRFI